MCLGSRLPRGLRVLELGGAPAPVKRYLLNSVRRYEEGIEGVPMEIANTSCYSPRKHSLARHYSMGTKNTIAWNEL